MNKNINIRVIYSKDKTKLKVIAAPRDEKFFRNMCEKLEIVKHIKKNYYSIIDQNRSHYIKTCTNFINDNHHTIL